MPPGPGLCGKPVPQVEIEILDEQGSSVPTGEVGEICVRPARSGDFAGVYTPMLGYWNRPDATAEALRDGRYHTGDLGFVAEDGNVYIRGRRNDLILRGGANVYPAEVERVIQSHPSVLAAAVLGLPDARLGQRVVAVVELQRYKVPEAVRFVAGMPRNAMNKIVKPRLQPLFDATSPTSHQETTP